MDLQPTIYHFFNRLFFGKSGAPKLSVPGFTTVTDDRCLLSADCLVVHVPSVIIANRVESLFKLRKLAPAHQIWVAESMESEVNYPPLADSQFMALFDVEMSYRQSAQVWMPYIPHELASIYRSTDAGPRTRQCCSFISSNFDKSDRQAYMTALMRELNVHSYGRYKRNRWLWRDRGLDTKLRVLSRYKYTLAFENSIATDYVTEKFYQPLLAGTVPIYLGAPNIEEFAPGDNCFINVADFDGPAELARFIRQADPADFQLWRKQDLRQSFVQKHERSQRTWPEMLSETLSAMLSINASR